MVHLTLSGSGTAFELDVPIRADVIDALKTQLDGLQNDKAYCQAVTDYLGRSIAVQISHIVDWDLCKPSLQQLRMAKRIMNTLAIGIPPEALLYKSAMIKFLEKYEDKYRSIRRKHV